MAAVNPSMQHKFMHFRWFFMYLVLGTSSNAHTASFGTCLSFCLRRVEGVTPSCPLVGEEGVSMTFSLCAASRGPAEHYCF